MNDTVSLHQLPSLDPLKGFVAAARHLSFTRAATELFLTQSAISRQIQTLEEQLGLRLFERSTRQLRLTTEGEILFRAASDMLDRLGSVVASLQAAERKPRVTVSATIAFVSLWLVPRLSDFQARHPDIDVRISADNRVVDLEREEVDLAVRFTAPAEAPRGSRHLFDESVLPVASPAVAAALGGRLNAASLERATLLVFEDGSDFATLKWSAWLAALGLAGSQPQAMIQFNHYDQTVRAAEAGQGVALGRRALIADALAAGRLVPLVEQATAMDDRAYFLVRSGRPRTVAVDAFAAWMEDQAKL